MSNRLNPPLPPAQLPIPLRYRSPFPNPPPTTSRPTTGLTLPTIIKQLNTDLTSPPMTNLMTLIQTSPNIPTTPTVQLSMNPHTRHTTHTTPTRPKMTIPLVTNTINMINTTQRPHNNMTTLMPPNTTTPIPIRHTHNSITTPLVPSYTHPIQ